MAMSLKRRASADPDRLVFVGRVDGAEFCVGILFLCLVPVLAYGTVRVATGATQPKSKEERWMALAGLPVMVLVIGGIGFNIVARRRELVIDRKRGSMSQWQGVRRARARETSLAGVQRIDLAHHRGRPPGKNTSPRDDYFARFRFSDGRTVEFHMDHAPGPVAGIAQEVGEFLRLAVSPKFVDE